MAKKIKRTKKRYIRKFSSRNYTDPAYREWRKSVYKRDGYKCQFPGCRCKKNLQAHHILKWAEYPHLRFDVQNGITLCRRHHALVNGKEENYIQMFHRILINKLEKINNKNIKF